MINSSVTIMMVNKNHIGFIRREKGDTFSNLLVAPGGRVEEFDGDVIDGVRYNSIECAGIREVKEETDIPLNIKDLHYFCSLTLPNGRVVISLYVFMDKKDQKKITFLNKDEINSRNDFAPGMKQEALELLEFLGIER